MRRENCHAGIQWHEFVVFLLLFASLGFRLADDGLCPE